MSGRLSGNIVWSIGGAVAYNGSRVLVIIILARLATPEDLGAFHYALAIAGPLALLAGLELRTQLATNPAAQLDPRPYEILRGWAAWSCAAALAALIAWEGWRGRHAVHLLTFAGLGAGRIAWMLTDVRWGWLQRASAWRSIALAQALRGAVLLATYLVVLGGVRILADPSAALNSQAAAAAALISGGVLLALEWRAGAGVPRVSASAALPSDSTPAVRGADAAPWNLIYAGLPLAAVQVLISLSDAVPRIALGADPRATFHSLGLLGGLTAIVMAIGVVLNAVAQTLSRPLALAHASGGERFARWALRFALGAAGVALAAWLAGWASAPWALAVLPAEFAALHIDFLILLAGQCILLPAAMLGYVVTSAGWRAAQFWLHMAVMLVTLSATVLLVRGEDALRGATWCTVVRALTQLGLYAAATLVCVRALRTGRPAVASLDRGDHL